MSQDLRFVSLGFGNAAQCNQVWMVMRDNTAQAGRIAAAAKSSGQYLDLTARRPRKSIIIFMNGVVAGSPFSVKTLYNRLRKACTDEVHVDAKSEKEISDEEEDALDDVDAEVDDEEAEDLDAN